MLQANWLKFGMLMRFDMEKDEEKGGISINVCSCSWCSWFGMQRCQGFLLWGGVSTGEADIVSLVIMSSQRAMNIYGSG